MFGTRKHILPIPWPCWSLPRSFSVARLCSSCLGSVLAKRCAASGAQPPSKSRKAPREAARSCEEVLGTWWNLRATSEVKRPLAALDLDNLKICLWSLSDKAHNCTQNTSTESLGEKLPWWIVDITIDLIEAIPRYVCYLLMLKSSRPERPPLKFI